MADYKSEFTGAQIDDGIKKARSALQPTGATMTGPLILSGDPASAKEAATKEYVDNHSAADAVQYVAQSLTTDQQAVARTNIGAASQEEVDTLSEEIEVLKGGDDAFSLSGNIVRCEPASGTPLTVKSDADVTVYSCGKNMIGMNPGNTGTIESFGVTYTFEDDGSVTLNGTQTIERYPILYHTYAANSVVDNHHSFGFENRFKLPEAIYSFSVETKGTVENGSAPIPSLGTFLPDESLYNFSGNNTFSAGQIVGLNGVYIGIQAGTTFKDYNIRFQFEVGSAATSYEKHTAIQEVMSGGSVEVSGLDGEYTVWASSGDVKVSGKNKSEEEPSGVLLDVTKYGLPMLYLTGDTSAMNKDNAVDLVYAYGDLSGTCSVKWQGSSSLQWEKKNYTIKFDNAFEAAEGWGAQKKYCFKANFIDHSHARNVCSCKLWGQIVKSRASVPAELADLPNGGAIDGFPCVIMLNGEFHGLYTWNIPKDGWMFGSPKAILCADAHTAATQFKALATLNGDFELEYAEDEDNTDWILTSINTAIQAAIDSDGSDLDTVVGQYIDIPSAIDYYIHAVAENATDGTDKNYILVTFDGVKWYFSDYDRDTVYGLQWTGKGFDTPVGGVTYGYYAGTHRLMSLIYNNKRADLKARAVALHEDVLSEANVATVFSNFIGGIPSQLLDADATQWPTIPGTSASNLAQILNWYRLRKAVVDAEIDAM